MFSVLYKSKIIGNSDLYYYFLKKIKFFFYFNDVLYENIILNIITDLNTNKFDVKEINAFIKNNKYNLIKKEIKLIGIGGYGMIFKLSDEYCLKVNIIDNIDSYHEFEIPQILYKLNDGIDNLITNPLTLIKNLPFDGLIYYIQFNIFLLYITYLYIYNKKFDSNYLNETLLINYDINKIYKSLFHGTKQTQKSAIIFFLYLRYKYLKYKVNINCLNHLLKITKVLTKKTFKKEGFIIILPLAKTISVDIKCNPNTKQINMLNGQQGYLCYKYIYRVLVLQICLCLLKINSKIKFIHNDLKPDNILVFITNNPYKINYEDIKYKFDLPFIFKLTDFDFSVLDKISNNKIKNTDLINNKFYWLHDIHFFIHRLFFYLKNEEILNDIDFFKYTYETFITPFCFKKFDKNNIEKNKSFYIIKNKNKVICNEGRYYGNNKPNKDLLVNFISSEWFDLWKIL